MARLTYDSILRDLKTRKASITCSELIDYLETLGFIPKSRNNGKHHTYTHSDIEGFEGGNFDCGHEKNGVIKLPYILKVISVLTKYEDAIKEFLKAEKK